MARLKGWSRRYGRITFASLGGCLMSIGTFLIVLSAATSTNVANANTWTLGDCMTGDASGGYPIAGMHCVGYDTLDATGNPGTDGVDDYWECCKYCAEHVPGRPELYPGCDIKAEYDDDYNDYTDHVDLCCNQVQQPPPLCGNNSQCNVNNNVCKTQIEATDGYCEQSWGSDCPPIQDATRASAMALSGGTCGCTR